MATKAQMLSSLLKDRFQAGVNTDLSKDAGYQAYQADLDKQRKIAQAQAQAKAADAAVAAQKNRNPLQTAVQFAPSVLANEAKVAGNVAVNVGKTVAKPFVAAEQAAVANFQHLAGPTRTQQGKAPVTQLVQDTQAKAQALPSSLHNKASRIGADDGVQLLQMVKDGKSNKDISTFLDQAIQRKTARDKQTIGDTAQIASLGLGGGGLVQAAKAGTGALLRTGAEVAGAGALGNTGYELASNPDASNLDLLKSAGVGAGTGLVLGAATGIVGQGVKDFRATPAVQDTTNAITDESRLLPAQGTQGAHVLPESHQLGQGQVDTNLAVPTTAADPAVVKRLGQVDKAIQLAQRQGGMNADQARALVRERQGLVQQIQNPAPEHVINRVAEVDKQLVTSKDPVKVASLSTERQQLVQALPVAEQKMAGNFAEVSKTALRSNEQIPSVAEKGDANAIARKLSPGYDDLPTVEHLNLADQAQKGIDLVKNDPESARAIALGQTPPPDGLTAGAVYRAVESHAWKTGDESLVDSLVHSPLAAQATRRGQENAVFAIKDPDSPIDAIRSINTLREAAQARDVSVPRNVSFDETKKILDLAKTAETKKQAWLDNGGELKDPKRLEFGRAQVAFRNHIDELKAQANKKQPIHVGKTITTIAGNTKSLTSSMDNSALFRQGWKTLWTHPGKWTKNSLRTWSDIVKTFGGKNTLDELAADIGSRPNADLYRQAKLAVGLDEEAYPAHWGEKLPLLGRAYKASEAAYVGFLQRQRADIFDKYIQIAKKTGVELDQKQLKSIGGMVNALTSRGNLGKLEPAGNALNNVFFSPRLLASHFQVLGGHIATGAGGSNFVRKQAALNLLKIASGTATVMAIADIVKPGSVEWDPRSSDFGKIRVGNTRFDVTGGMGSVVVLASRLAKMSTKSSTTGDVKSLNGGGFNSTTGEDLVVNFFENKLSPAAGVVRDVLRGEDFNGNKPSPKSIALGLVTPITIQNVQQYKQPGAANGLVATIADGLGISANNYTPSSNWKSSNSKELAQFKDKIGDKKFIESYNTFDKQYSDWYTGVQKTARFKALSNDDKTTVRENKANEFKQQLFDKYDFTYTPEKKDRGRLKGF